MDDDAGVQNGVGVMHMYYVIMHWCTVGPLRPEITVKYIAVSTIFFNSGLSLKTEVCWVGGVERGVILTGNISCKHPLYNP